ncbi:hypothetical protein AGDE_14999 [Angomonas deanei]|uniref:EF-hand domain-containing protein n=1 Tax=Angomonas deanei TaxID=59799 RepID=A0A7G2CK08_9TRYP|nr:hypothetical protein AGDE_14999 [Angomonas deanei]CAD2220210.1 hypothetical protein, conserved [Angomonas deanei]|eukprot:EPY19854.1 hypothetical protein AGDE_14999 [Angomonas deanei]
MNFGVFCHWVNNHRDQMKEKMFGLNFKEYIDAVLYFRTYDNTYENCIPREVFLELCVTPQEGKAMASTTTRALELLHDVLGEGGGDVTLDQYLRMIQYIRENNLQKYYNPNASTSDYCAFLGVPLGSPRHPARRPGRDNLSLPPLNNGRLSSPSSPFNYSTSNPNTTAPAGMAPLPPNVANNNNTNNGSGNNVMNMSGSGTLNTSFPSAGNTALPPLSARGHHTNHALTPKPEDLVYSGGRSTVNNNHNNSNIYGKATYVTAGRVRRTASADYDNESTSTSTETTTVGGGRKKKKEKECSVM